jgi:hypothetical protein
VSLSRLSACQPEAIGVPGEPVPLAVRRC